MSKVQEDEYSEKGCGIWRMLPIILSNFFIRAE